MQANQDIQLSLLSLSRLVKVVTFMEENDGIVGIVDEEDVEADTPVAAPVRELMDGKVGRPKAGSGCAGCAAGGAIGAA